MKHTLTYAILASCLSLTLTSFGQGTASLKDDPAYLDIDGAIDLKVIKPAVNVNVPKFLLKSALSEFDGGDGDPIANMGINLKEITQGIKLLRIVVFEGTNDHEKEIEKGLAKLRAKLEVDWVPIVAVPDDNVHIYARSDEAGEELAGLALVVADGDDAVIGNVVGNVPIGKIAKIAAQLGSEMVPAEILEKLAGFNVDVTHEEIEEDGDHENEDEVSESSPSRF